MGKLWQKNYSLDKLVEEFTVGEDYLLDRSLVNADCVASIAHAEMLHSIGILTAREYEALKAELLKIVELNDRGDFPLEISDEDCHTAIENHLTEALGTVALTDTTLGKTDPGKAGHGSGGLEETNLSEAGKKIHTGRSRNDQVIAALRLYSRSFLLDFQKSLLMLCGSLLALARKYEKVPMPGRTHMQIAMPSSIGLWASAYAEDLLDDLALIQTAYDLNNTSPLGSAASYGVPLPLDRERVAEALAFAGVQNNVLYVNNSRGKMESIIVDALEQVMLCLSKLSQDLILYSMPEFGYFALPRELCTGSSIMPQKRNPDMLELIRAKTSSLMALNIQIKGIIKGLPSGYNRDFQETKSALIRGFRIALSSVQIMDLVVAKVVINEERLLKGFVPEIFATDRVLELVSGGMSFRDAYRVVGEHIEELASRDPRGALDKRTSSGTPGNLNLGLVERRIRERAASLEKEEKRVSGRLKALTGTPVRLY